MSTTMTMLRTLLLIAGVTAVLSTLGVLDMNSTEAGILALATVGIVAASGLRAHRRQPSTALSTH